MSTPSLPTDLAPKLLVAASLLAGVLSLLFSGLFWSRFRIDITIEDTVSMLPLVQSLVETGWNSIGLQEWVAPHASAHRIVVGRLLMAADYKYLAGDNTLFYLACWLSIATLCYLYFSSARLSKPRYTHVPLFMLGMALIYTCSFTLTRNLISPINSLWYISAACSALSVYLFTAPGRNITVLRAASACLLSIIAAYSTFLGVVGALVLALLAIQSRSRHSLWVTPLMLVFVVLYMRDIRTVAQVVLDSINAAGGPNPYGTHLDVLFDFKKRMFDFTIVFLSSPMSKSPTLLSYFYVIPSICLILFGWMTLARQWFTAAPDGGSAEKFYLAMATVFLGTALACSLGRTSFNVPFDSRYQTIVMLYWLSVSGLLVYRMKDVQLTGIKAGSMLLVLLIPLGLLYNQSAFDLKRVVQKSFAARNIEVSTRMGIPLSKAYPHTRNLLALQYIEYESFLAHYTTMRAISEPDTLSGGNALPFCEDMRLELAPRLDAESKLADVRLRVDGKQFQRYREVRLSGEEGGYGYLFETPRAPVTTSNLVWGGTVWRGYYIGDADSSSYTLVFDAILGPDLRCRLQAES